MMKNFKIAFETLTADCSFIYEHVPLQLASIHSVDCNISGDVTFVIFQKQKILKIKKRKTSSIFKIPNF